MYRFSGAGEYSGTDCATGSTTVCCCVASALLFSKGDSDVFCATGSTNADFNLERTLAATSFKRSIIV